MGFDRSLLVAFERAENVEIEVFFASWMAVYHFLFVIACSSWLRLLTHRRLQVAFQGFDC